MAAEAANIKSKPAKESAQQLLRQLDLISHMVLMPYLILITAESEIQTLWFSLDVIIGRKHKLGDSRRLFEKHSKRTMKRFFALDVSGSLSRPWLSAITVYIWTAFECLAGDLWVNSLNHRTSLAHRTINSLPHGDAEKSGLSRKQIDMGLAARYNFDLRRHLGTALKPKFDFNSFDGIQSAYEQAFGTSGKLDSYAGLKELEQVRHLIVHRGGITDDKFLRITKLTAKRGVPFSIGLSKVCGYMMDATLGCVALLKVVDEWLTANE